MTHTQNVPMIISEYDYDHAKDHLIGLVEDIYRTGSLEDMEFHLEEILGVFDLNIPRTKPLIYSKKKSKSKTKPKEKLDDLIELWKIDTISYGKSFCKQT